MATAAEKEARERWAAWLTERMKARGLSDYALAKEIGESRSRVRKWTIGSQPPLSVARKLARALGVSVHALVKAAEGAAVALLA